MIWPPWSHVSTASVREYSLSAQTIFQLKEHIIMRTFPQKIVI